MRKLLLLGFAAAAFLLPVEPSFAYRQGPWCANYNVGFDFVHEECTFMTFARCNAEARLQGSSAFCVLNARYPGNWSERAERQPRKHRRHRRHR
jgi:Protein of unknown function (DUF3551)